MLPHDLETQLVRMRSHFNTRSYGEEFVKLLWPRVKHLQASSLVRIVDDFISNSRHAPLMSDFLDATARIGQTEQRPFSKIFASGCRFCGGDGFILLEHSVTQSTGCGSCEQCAAGRSLATRANHAIMSVSRAYSLGYIPASKAPKMNEKIYGSDES